MAGPMNGVRVIDLSAMASGPMATQILGDQGADVIKVEPPETGDLLRKIGRTRHGTSAVFVPINRSKRSVVLNLRDAKGVALAKRLVAGADVFVQNFIPGAIDRMGLGYDVLRAIEPELIYVSISGFGETGPYARKKVYDSVMQGISGMAGVQGRPGSGEPELVRHVVIDKHVATTVAQAVSAALFARERGAGGQHIRIAMLDVAIAFLWPDAFQSLTWVGDEEDDAQKAGAFYGIRRSRDGFLLITAFSDREFGGLCRALERTDLIEDPRFRSLEDRMRDWEPLHAILDEVIRGFDTADLCERLDRESIPNAPINWPETLHEDPQVAHRGIIFDSEHPHWGPIRQTKPPVGFEGTPAEISRPTPMLGEHTDEVLRELGLDRAELAALRERKVIS